MLVTLSVRDFERSIIAHTFHFRTEGGGHEVDVIAETGVGVIGIEVKLGMAPYDKDVRHLIWLGERLGDDLLDAVVIATGSEAYRRPDGIAVVPLALLGP